MDIMRGEERAGLRLRELYRRHGYLPYRMSKFEPYDLYVRNKSFLVSEDILTFTDTDGCLMALKPDVTLSIVKNARDGGGLQKVYYHEHVYRTSPAAVGYREILQTGLECMGDLDLFAEGEVLYLASESLEAISGGDYLLDVSHMGFVSALLAGLEEDVRSALLRELGWKNASGIRSVCAQAGAAKELSDGLCRLALLYGPPAEVLPVLEGMVRGPEAAGALAELSGLCGLMESRGAARRLRLDFSIANDMSYYNGVIFRGYLPGLPSGVLAGGRYDNLMRRMGKTGGAVGFAVYLDQLERLEKKDSFDGDILLLYNKEDDPAAVAREAEKLIRQGRVVRAERQAPAGLRYRDVIRFGEGGGR